MRNGAERVQIRKWLFVFCVGLAACGGRTLDDGSYEADGSTGTTSCTYRGATYADGAFVPGSCFCICDAGHIECEAGCTSPNGGASSGGNSSGGSGNASTGGTPTGGAAAGGTTGKGGAATAGSESGGSVSVGGVSTGGAAGSSTTGGSATGGSAGATALSCGPPPRADGSHPLIDDMESNTAIVPRWEGRNGGWYTYNDGTGGFQAPDPSRFTMTLVSADATNGMYVANTYGKGFSSWGAGMGFVFNSGCPYDASVYRGVHFFARADESASLYVMLPTAATTPIENGGTCISTEGVCYDDYEALLPFTGAWQEFYVSFQSLTQQGFGARVSFDPKTLIAVNFQTVYLGGAAFSYAVDQISFY
jgi:hypothetical protein